MIVDFVEESLGSKKQIIAKSRVRVRCDRCGKEWETAWEHRRKREYDYCGSCRNAIGITGLLGKGKKGKETK